MRLNSPERMDIDPSDMPFEVGVISKVGDGYIEMGRGWCVGVSDEACKWAQPGMTYELWGKGTGFDIRGIAIDGKIVRYQTVAEHEAQQIKDRQDRKEAEREAFEKGKETYFAEIAALPEELRARFARFQAGSPDFDVNYGGYELHCCKEAVVIANQARARVEKDVPAVDEFWNWLYKKEYPSTDEPPTDKYDRWLFWAKALDYKHQKEVMGINDDHSGNTLEMALKLARALLTNPEFATRMHGALTPLVGCEAYGCTHEREA